MYGPIGTGADAGTMGRISCEGLAWSINASAKSMFMAGLPGGTDGAVLQGDGDASNAGL